MMVNVISSNQAAEWLASGEAILIDVREADEFKEEHIAYAMSLPLGKITDYFSYLNIPKTRKVIFQCLKGSRGGEACAAIIKTGSCDNEIYNLEGGITSWKENNLPIIGSDKKSSGSGLSIFRQVQIIVGGLIAAFVLLGFIGASFAFAIAGLLGFMLFLAGFTGWCGLAMLLSKMPWNK